MPPADTLPNAAFIDDPGVVSDKLLDSLSVLLPPAPLSLAFRHNFNLQASSEDPNLGYDGSVLELSSDGGNTFQDILAAGGSFFMGGYNRTISTDRGNPIAGREALERQLGRFYHDRGESTSDSDFWQASLADGQRYQRFERRLAR